MDTPSSEVQVFADLTDDEIDLVFRILPVCQYASGAIVFEADSQDTAMYVVLKGGFEVVALDAAGARTVMTRLKSGTVFGELSFLDGLPRSASVQAVEESQALRITREAFAELTQAAPGAAVKIYRDLACVVSMRLRQANAVILRTQAQ